jgi:hypothetical protein
MLERGLYEKTIGTDLRRELDAEDDELVSQTERLDHADAARVLAAYAEEAVKQALDSIEGDDAPVRQARLVNSLIDNLASQLKDSDSRLSDLIEGERVDLSRTKPEQLLSLVPRQNASVAEQKKGLVRPLTSVAQTSLFTGAAHEPQLFSELRREIASADEILMLVSFVKWSGLRLLEDALEDFAERGGKLRAITTTYVGRPTRRRWRHSLPSPVPKSRCPTTRSAPASMQRPMSSEGRPGTRRPMWAPRTSRTRQ